jgi:hypothetical protein
MSVTFVRTGERCYAVRAAVEGMPIVEMDPAPGYDALVPHDLQHFIVERALGIEGAIYGQLLAECQLEMHPTKAVGGTAGTFHTICSAPPRQASRDQRKRDRKSSKLTSSQRADCARSERATYVCWYDWLNHSGDPARRVQALKMKEIAESMLLAMSREERVLYTPEKLIAIRSQFSELSRRWAALKIGEGFTEPW